MEVKALDFTKGFPFPEGEWKNEGNDGDLYFYRKEYSYVEKMREIETRVSYQLAYTYSHDFNPLLSPFEKSLNEQDIVLIYNEENSVVSLILKSNNIKHHRVKYNELEGLSLNPKTQAVVISDSPLDIEEDIKGLNILSNFVENGGTILSFNTGGNLLNKAFPNKIGLRNGTSTMDKPIKIELHADENYDQVLKLYKDQINKNRLFIRRRGIQRFKVLDEEIVKVLAKEVAPTPDQPIMVYWKHGQGHVYHLLMSHIVAKLGDEGIEELQGLADLLELPSKEAAQEVIKELEESNPEKPPLATIKAWKAAFNCGFYIPINMAKALTLPIEFLIEFLNKILQKVEK